MMADGEFCARRLPDTYSRWQQGHGAAYLVINHFKERGEEHRRSLYMAGIRISSLST